MNTTDADAPGLADGAEGSLVGPDDSPHVTASAVGGSWWTGLRGFWAVAALLLLILLGLIPVMNNGTVAVPDDGVYAAQARLLAKGSWSEQRPAASIDSNGFNSAVGPDFTYEDRQIPYLKHPLLSVTLGGFYRAGGFGGLLVFSVLGAWLAAVSAGLVARRLRVGLGIPALLVTALGSPLLFDAYLVTAHGVAAGLVGLVTLGVTTLVGDRRWIPLLYVLPCAALLTGLRTEGAVALAATSIVVGVMAVSTRPLRLDRYGSVASISILAVTTAAYFVDAWWSATIKSGKEPGDSPLIRGFIQARDPLNAAWVSLLRPWYGTAEYAQVPVVLAVAAIIVAAIAIKVSPEHWLLPVTLLLLSASCLVYQAFQTPLLISGMFAAFPLLPAGLILLRSTDLRITIVRRNLGIAGLAAVVITATTYAEGGALEWGGRFYHLLIPLLVPVILLGMVRGYADLPSRVAPVATIALAVCVISLSIIALDFSRSRRGAAEQIIRSATSFAMAHSSVSSPDGARPLIIVALMNGDGTGRLFWRQTKEVDVLAANGIGDTFRLMKVAEAAGYPSVTLMTNVPPQVLSLVGKARLKGSDWGVRQVDAVPGTPFGVVRFGPDTAARR